MSGTAELVDDGAVEQINKLAKYIGAAEYPWLSQGERRVTIRIRPDKVGGYFMG